MNEPPSSPALRSPDEARALIDAAFELDTPDFIRALIAEAIVSAMEIQDE